MPTDALIPVPADAAARDDLLGRVSALAALDHPRVEPVGEPAVRDDGRLAVPRGPGVATDLPTLLTVRGRLAAGEVGEVLVGVAQGLAALHSAGVAHGRVEAADVGLAADGAALLRPRLDGDGAPGGATDARCADDVHGLAALADELLGTGDGEDAVALRAVLAPALAPDPRVRPEAGTLAAQAAAAVVTEPVRMPERARLVAAALGAGAGARAGAGAGRGHDAPGARGGSAPVASRRGTRARAVARRPGRTVRDGAPATPARTRRAAGARRRDAGRRVPGVVARGVVARGAGAVGVLALVAVLAGVALQVRQPEETVGAAPTTAVATPAAAGTGATARPGAAGDAAQGDDAAPGDDAVPAAAVPAAVRDRSDPAGAAAALTRHRVALLSGAAGSAGPRDRSAAMARVDLAGSAAHAADVELLARLAADGTTVHDVDVDVLRTRVVSGDDESATVTVDYRIGAHDQRAADGTTTAVAATGTRRVELGLTWTDDGWRVSAVS